jgi:hypothetical protein
MIKETSCGFICAGLQLWNWLNAMCSNSREQASFPTNKPCMNTITAIEFSVALAGVVCFSFQLEDCRGGKIAYSINRNKLGIGLGHPRCRTAVLPSL